MRAAQWLLPAGSTVFVGCVGRDANGARLREVAQADGLQVEYLEDETAPTGTCACLISDGGRQRSLVANLGAANKYQLEHVLSPSMQAILANAKIVYISGYFLTVSPATVMHVIQQARQRGQVSGAGGTSGCRRGRSPCGDSVGISSLPSSLSPLMVKLIFPAPDCLPQLVGTLYLRILPSAPFGGAPPRGLSVWE